MSDQIIENRKRELHDLLEHVSCRIVEFMNNPDSLLAIVYPADDLSNRTGSMAEHLKHLGRPELARRLEAVGDALCHQLKELALSNPSRPLQKQASPGAQPELREARAEDAYELLPTLADILAETCDVLSPGGSAPATRTYSVADVCDMAGTSDATVHKYARKAGVNTPARGQRNHRYTGSEVRSILRAIIDHSGNCGTRERCRRALESL